MEDCEGGSQGMMGNAVRRHALNPRAQGGGATQGRGRSQFQGEDRAEAGRRVTLFHQPCGGAGGCSRGCGGRRHRGWSGGLPAANC